MVAPVIVGGAVLGAGLLGWLMGDTKKSSAVQTPTQTVAPVISPTTTNYPFSRYQPYTSTQYSPRSTRVYSPQYDYSPQIAYQSPGSSFESKKEQSSQIDAEAGGSASQTGTPTWQQPTTFSAPTTATQPTTASPMNIGGDMGMLMVLGIVGVGAFMLMKD